MGDSKNERVNFRYRIKSAKAKAIFFECVIRPYTWVMDMCLNTIRLKFSNEINDLAVSEVCAVFFEGNAQNSHVCPINRTPSRNHAFDGLLCNKLSHPVVN